jgi:hypothetical protein
MEKDCKILHGQVSKLTQGKGMREKSFLKNVKLFVLSGKKRIFAVKL